MTGVRWHAALPVGGTWLLVDARPAGPVRGERLSAVSLADGDGAAGGGSCHRPCWAQRCLERWHTPVASLTRKLRTSLGQHMCVHERCHYRLWDGAADLIPWQWVCRCARLCACDSSGGHTSGPHDAGRTLLRPLGHTCQVSADRHLSKSM